MRNVQHDNYFMMYVQFNEGVCCLCVLLLWINK